MKIVDSKGITNTIFIAGLVVAILVASGISYALVSTMNLKGEKGDTGATGAVGPSGDSGPLEIVAAGSVSDTGEIFTGYNIDSVTWDTNRFRINITDTYFRFRDFITVVTVGSGDNRVVSINSVSGSLLVYLYDTNGDPIQDDFQFVVYKVHSDS